MKIINLMMILMFFSFNSYGTDFFSKSIRPDYLRHNADEPKNCMPCNCDNLKVRIKKLEEQLKKKFNKQ